MRPSLCAFLMLTGMATAGCAHEFSSLDEPAYEPLTPFLWGQGFGIAAYIYPGSNRIDLGVIEADDLDSWRVELQWTMVDDPLARGSLYGGSSFFFEDNEQNDAELSLDAPAWGGSGEIGYRLWFLHPRWRRPINLSLTPFLRAGVGIQRLSVRTTDPDTGEALRNDGAAYRFEGAVGLELSVLIAGRMEIGLGAGATAWLGETQTFDRGDSGDTVRITPDGQRLWWRGVIHWRW